MSKTERLKAWAETLNRTQLEDIIVELTYFAIEAEYINFWEDSKVPIWDGTGETLDGTELEEN